MARPTKAQIQTRTEEVLLVRLQGGAMWNVREWVREKEREEGSAWFLADGAKPLSDSQLWRYIARADKLAAENYRASAKRLLRTHLVRREHLYGMAVLQGDVRAALAVLADAAAIEGLYPAAKRELTGKAGAPIVLQIKEEVVTRPDPDAPHPLLARITEEVVTLADLDRPEPGGGQDGPPAPGAAGLPPV
jgi:hypothetical protein